MTLDGAREQLWAWKPNPQALVLARDLIQGKWLSLGGASISQLYSAISLDDP
jgi:hypothetical protein